MLPKSLLQWIACSFSVVFLFPFTVSADPVAANSERYATVYGAAQFSKSPPPAWADNTPLPVAQQVSEPNTLRLGELKLRWDDSGKTAYFRRAIQANNAGGIQQLGQVQIEYNPAFQTMALHTLKILRGDATIDKINTVSIRFLERELGLEQSIYSGAVTVALLIDDVRVGDTLELAYSIHGDNPVFNGNITEDNAWETQSPVLLRRVSLQFPPQRNVAYRFIGATAVAAGLKPVERTVDGMHEMSFEQRNIAPFRFEDFYPRGYQPLTWLQISDYKNWNQVAQWAAELFRTPAVSNTEFSELVSRFRGIGNPAKRAAAALDFVQSEIRYTSVSFGENSHRPAAPDEVLKRRYGDCKDKTLLLVSFLRALGMEARPVLVSVGSHAGFAAWLPSTTPFDHAIVKLDLQGQTYWLDPTALQAPRDINALGKLHGGADVLVVDTKTDRLQTIPQGAPDVFTVRERVSMTDFEDAAVLEKTSIVTGVTAENLRRTLAQTAPEEIKKNLINDVQFSYTEPQWLGEPLITDDVEKNVITYVGKYRIKNYAEKFSDGWALRHRPVYIASFFKVPDAPRRNAPYALAYPVNAVYVHEIDLPQSATVNAPNATTIIEDRFFSVRRIEQRQGHSARVEYTFATRTEAVPPNDMDTYVADIRRVQNEIHTTVFIPLQNVANAGSEDIEKYRKAAEKGHATAQFELGMIYAKGLGVPRDFQQAYSWWRRAAEQGHANAQYYLGLLYDDGEGVLRDYRDAAVWYRKAADQNIAPAQYRLGLLFSAGTIGKGVDKEEAVKWWRKAAELGDVNAQLELGVAYAKAEGVPHNDEEACRWWEKAAAQNSHAAQNNMGVAYEYGGGRNKDLKQALYWYRKAAEQGYAMGQYNLARLLGSSDASPADLQQAYTWMSKAADSGLAQAEYSLGVILIQGRDHARDIHQGLIWLLRAAEQNDARAQYALGAAYEGGIGFEKDQQQAKLWYERAAGVNYGRAQYALGRLNSAPQKNGPNLEFAYKWFGLAEKNGATEAAKERAAIVDNMTPEQIARAEHSITLWAKSPTIPKITPSKIELGGQPEYPDQARRLGAEGDVVLNVTVNGTGSVDAVMVESSSGSPLLDEAAKAAVWRYTYSPARQDNVAVASQKKVRITFHLSRDETASATQ